MKAVQGQPCHALKFGPSPVGAQVAAIRAGASYRRLTAQRGHDQESPRRSGGVGGRDRDKHSHRGADVWVVSRTAYDNAGSGSREMRSMISIPNR